MKVNINKIITTNVIRKFNHYFVGIRNKDNPNICWFWNGYIEPNKYGTFMVYQIKYSAHRVLYLYHNNLLYSEFQVLHKPKICKSKSCVNPSHLYLGDHSDNAIDTIIEGTCNGFKRIGSKHPYTDFIEADILYIRYMVSIGIRRQDLADKYNVSTSCIDDIINRKTWKHI
jgi:hypothetical protein